MQLIYIQIIIILISLFIKLPVAFIFKYRDKLSLITIASINLILQPLFRIRRISGIYFL